MGEENMSNEYSGLADDIVAMREDRQAFVATLPEENEDGTALTQEMHMKANGKIQ